MRRYLRKLVDIIQQARLSRTDYARWKGVTVGRDCRIITRVFGTEPFLIEIGDRVTVADKVAFLTHDGATCLLRDERGRKQRYAPIRIGNDCFIGYGAILLPGVQIGDRVIVGAGSVVTRSVPSNSVVAGNPARRICSFMEWANKPFRHEAEAVGSTYEERVRSLAA
jgi:acetyltransferase-like isoleucine patch superfamily enzyme